MALRAAKLVVYILRPKTCFCVTHSLVKDSLTDFLTLILAAAGIVAAVSLFVFNTFFAIGWLGMTWLYPAEIVPLRIRAPANALSTSANWAFNFMVVMSKSLGPPQRPIP
jgi:hypothetical protein